MVRRQNLPRMWLMTDERLGERLVPIIGRLPPGAGVVFRHYSLEETLRRRLFDAVRAQSVQRDVTLLLGGTAQLAAAWGADGSHGRGPGVGLRSASVHTLAEIETAELDGAALLFLSPVFATRSHPGAPPLGPERFDALAASTDLPVIALGGLNANRARMLHHAHGWAGIDAWDEEAGNAV